MKNLGEGMVREAAYLKDAVRSNLCLSVPVRFSCTCLFLAWLFAALDPAALLHYHTHRHTHRRAPACARMCVPVFACPYSLARILPPGEEGARTWGLF